MIGKFKSRGRIIYDPYRGGMKRRTKWWAIVAVDREITRYYRWWVNQRLWGRRIALKPWLHAPAWNAHISIIRGEEPRHEYRKYWKKYHGEIVEFEYEHYPKKSSDIKGFRRNEEGDFWFVEAYCPRLLKIRDELGLQTHYRFHITFGRSYL